MWVGIIQPTEGLNRANMWRKSEYTLSLSCDIHLLLPCDICAPGSRASEFTTSWLSSLQTVRRLKAQFQCNPDIWKGGGGC